ncbi:hypothetical protein C8R44DRAFT_879333 [Mycena epipterygia]|nr:hypothetical protein C8R44DRAFT_879333 [Mycena epipterygia]
MSSLSETSLSLLASGPPMSTTTKVIVGAFLIALMACLIHVASPMRLTYVLVTAIDNVEKTYFEAIEAGVLSKSDAHTVAMLSALQIEVSNIREVTLRNSLSTRWALREFFRGRTLTVLGCIREVRKLETHIEILKEEHLRAANPPAFETAARTVSLRQRHTHSSSLDFYKRSR